MAFSASTRQLLRALHRGQTVKRGVLGGWQTSGGDQVSGHDVHILEAAKIIEFIEWGKVRMGVRIGIKARLRPREPARRAESSVSRSSPGLG